MGKQNRTGAYALGGEADLHSILNTRLRSTALAIRTATVGTVVTYDPIKQEAEITVDHLQVVNVAHSDVPGADPDTSNTTALQAPIRLTAVPVYFAGSGDATSYASFPILPGSTGLLIIVDRSLDTWINRATPIPVDPVKSSIHSLADAVFLPGFTDRLHRITPPPSNTAAVFEGPEIHLGPLAVQGVARLNDPASASAAMIAWATTVETAINALAPGTFTPGVNSFASIVQNNFAAISGASTKVKAE